MIATQALEMENDKGGAIWPGCSVPSTSASRSSRSRTLRTPTSYFRGQLLALWYESGRPQRWILALSSHREPRASTEL